MASKVEMEVECKSNAEKIWNNIRDSTTVFPKALPHLFEGIEVVEGDGKSVGSVRLIKYPPGLSAISSIKEKIELVDEEKKTLSYSVIEGGVYTNFKASLSVSTKGSDGGSVVKWWCEYDKAREDCPNPDLIKDFGTKTFQDLDAFILANP
ncbi:hypothetical protein ACS0TY_010065 [Phlomoides rotata]